MAGIVDTSAANTSASAGVTVNANGLFGNQKGAYTEIFAATSEKTYWLELIVTSPIFDEPFLIDISTGANLAEAVQIANIPFYGNGDLNPMKLLLPITIGANQRVSVRCQSGTAGSSIEIMMYLYNDASYGTSTENSTLGSNAGTSRGVAVDAGLLANTKGAYSELVASIGHKANYIVLIVGPNDNDGQSDSSFLLDVALGIGKNVIVQNILHKSSAVELQSDAYAFWQDIESGDSVSVRAQSTTGDSLDRIRDVSILAFNMTSPGGVRNPLRGPVG